MNKKFLMISILSAIVIIGGIFLFTRMPVEPEPAPVVMPRADDAEATEEGIASVINANNQFALDFYTDLRNREAGKNIFFSPYSISTALAMVYEGARGETAEEIRNVFHFPEDDTIRKSSIAAVINLLNKEEAKHELHTANALWLQKDYQILNEYIETIERFFLGKATDVDFVGAAEEAREMINTWIEDKTKDRIKDLIPKGVLGDLTRLVITNAIYFKGNWAIQFDKQETQYEDFRVNKDQTVRVPMMRRIGEEARFYYAETEKLQILEMIYEGEDLSMLVLLPKNEDLESLEKMLTVENLNQWREELREQRVDVFMPKFTFDSKYFLKENLKEMGMPTAFRAPSLPLGADFSGISGEKDLYIHSVIHQAFINVDEEGTEAAAATGVIFGIEAIPEPIPVFRADHPFIFLIQERETGIILFMGRVINPAE